VKKNTLILPAILLMLAILTTPLIGTTQASSETYFGVSENSDGLAVIANITLGDKDPGTIAIDEVANRVYVEVDTGLVVIDGETDKVVAEIPLTDSVLDLEVNPKTNRIYVLEQGLVGNEVIVIDGATHLKVGQIESPYRCDITSIAVNPVANLIYLGFVTQTLGEYDQVQVYNGESLTLSTTVNIPGSGVHVEVERVDLSVNPNINKIYALWSGDDSLYLINGDTYTITKTVQLSIYLPIINPYTNYLYVVGEGSGYLVLNGETLEEVTSVDFGTLKAIDQIHNFLYTTEYGEDVYFGDRLYRIDGTTQRIIDSLLLPEHVWEMAMNPKTSKIYISPYGIGNISIIVVSTNAMHDSEPVLSLLSPENKTYAVSNFPLIFTASETLREAKYSLDGKENKTLSFYEGWNTTLYSLSEGQHTIIVYGEDIGENVGKSQLIQFWIGEKSTQNPPTWLIPLTGVVGMIIVVAISISIVLKRRKKR
jgi:DNA-binding beta-propeller fold protein YncE